MFMKAEGYELRGKKLVFRAAFAASLIRGQGVRINSHWEPNYCIK